MPYIKKADRPMFDTMIDGLVPKIRSFDCMQMGEVAATLVINAPLTVATISYSSAIGQSVGDIIRALAKRIRVRGDANYCICRIVLEGMKPETGWSYHSLSDVVIAFDAAINFIYDVQRVEKLEDIEMAPALSVLGDAATEIERRLLGPYEDTAILKNGDMACFNEAFALKPLPALNMSGAYSGRFACGCKPCQCEPEGEPILDVFYSEAIKGEHMPPITEALTQAQWDAVNLERRSNE